MSEKSCITKIGLPAGTLVISSLNNACEIFLKRNLLIHGGAQNNNL